MRLGNILMMQGGQPETGRAVRFQLRQRVKGGKTVRKWCDAVILPLGEDERAAALAAARAYCAEHPEADPASEQVLHQVQRFLHDPDNLAQKWALETELQQLRAGLQEDQLVWLLKQYQEHIRIEYSELLPPTTKEELEAQLARVQKQLAALEEEALGESQPAQG
jgi:hypothetical protein